MVRIKLRVRASERLRVRVEIRVRVRIKVRFRVGNTNQAIFGSLFYIVGYPLCHSFV
jgi:hypothetical protein